MPFKSKDFSIFVVPHRFLDILPALDRRLPLQSSSCLHGENWFPARTYRDYLGSCPFRVWSKNLHKWIPIVTLSYLKNRRILANCGQGKNCTPRLSFYVKHDVSNHHVDMTSYCAKKRQRGKQPASLKGLLTRAPYTWHKMFTFLPQTNAYSDCLYMFTLVTSQV